MDDLVDTTEMYLKSVLESVEEGIIPLRARIVERLEHSGPTVTETVARMQRAGLINVGEQRRLEFTEAGQRRAVGVMRKHRLAERFLADVVGLDWSHLHEEACRWEHVMSDEVEARLDALLGNPDHSPYGNPIPPSADAEWPPHATTGETNLVRFVADHDAPLRGRVVWLGEPLQVDVALLGLLAQAGVVPGATGTLRRHGPSVRIRIDEHEQILELPHHEAARIFVAPLND